MEKYGFEEISAEKEDFYSDDDIFNFNSWGADLSFRELIERYDQDELVKPEMQRNYVWDKVEASRFVESLLLGLPVPSIFLAKTEDEKLLIVDGYQRIITVYDYVQGISNIDGKIFKLTDSKKINIRWRGKAFSELSDIEQRRIKNTTIHAIIFSQRKPINNNTGMYQIFERINTSGRTLMPQEIRNCVYQNTKMNKLLLDLNHLEHWRQLFGNSSTDTRMRDMELILRFFAIRQLYISPPLVTSISLKKVLNEYMGDLNNNTLDAIEMQHNLFEETARQIFEIMGEEAFHNINTKSLELIPKFHPTVFDSIMIAVSTMSENMSLEALARNRIKLLTDSTYQDLLRNRTTNVQNIIDRIDLVKQNMME